MKRSRGDVNEDHEKRPRSDEDMTTKLFNEVIRLKTELKEQEERHQREMESLKLEYELKALALIKNFRSQQTCYEDVRNYKPKRSVCSYII
jgi:hypothetical protein